VRCEVVGGELACGHETTDARFFARDGVPELSEWRTTAAHVALMYRHLDSPLLEASFD
jgi:hypothetical protein